MRAATAGGRSAALPFGLNATRRNVKAAAISPRKCLRCTEIAPGKSGSVSPRCVASVRISSATRVRPCRHATFSKCGSSALVSSGFLHAHMSVNSVNQQQRLGPHKHSRGGRCCADAHPEEDEERAGVPMHCRQLNRREASPAHAEPITFRGQCALAIYCLRARSGLAGTGGT